MISSLVKNYEAVKGADVLMKQERKVIGVSENAVVPACVYPAFCLVYCIPSDANLHVGNIAGNSLCPWLRDLLRGESKVE